MNKNLSMLGVWSGVAFVGLFLVAFVFFAQWIFPMPPSWSAEQVAQLFEERAVPLRISSIIITLIAALYLPWTVMISELIQKMQGTSKFLANTQLISGVLSSITFFLPGYMWAVATFRTGRAPETTQLIVDLGWLTFITGIGPFLIQYIALGIAIFMDKNPIRVFPRWVGYFQIWLSISFLPAVLAFFMKTGPFAWNGFFVWWIPLTLFTAWFVVMAWYCRIAILNHNNS